MSTENYSQSFSPQNQRSSIPIDYAVRLWLISVGLMAPLVTLLKVGFKEDAILATSSITIIVSLIGLLLSVPVILSLIVLSWILSVRATDTTYRILLPVIGIAGAWLILNHIDMVDTLFQIEMISIVLGSVVLNWKRLFSFNRIARI